MAKRTVQCPQCGASYQIDEANMGKRARCSKCGNSFTLALAETDHTEPGVAQVAEHQPSSDPLDSLASASAERATPPPPPVSPSPTAAAPGAYRTPAGFGLSRLCLACGYQGYMQKKSPVWVIILAIVFFPFGPTASLPRKFWRGRHRKNDKRTFHVGQNRLTVNPMENLSSVQNRLQSES